MRTDFSYKVSGVGKCTIFNALISASEHIANYLSCTIEPNVVAIIVSDERLEKLRSVLAASIPSKVKINFFYSMLPDRKIS